MYQKIKKVISYIIGFTIIALITIFMLYVICNFAISQYHSIKKMNDNLDASSNVVNIYNSDGELLASYNGQVSIKIIESDSSEQNEQAAVH